MVYDDEMTRNGDIWEFTSRIGHFLYRVLYRDNSAPTGVNMPFPSLRTFE
jgi:hypothetical protein